MKCNSNLSLSTFEISHLRLRRAIRYISSEYFPGKNVDSGDMVLNGNATFVRHEDLMSPSFPPDSLNLVISTEVFEQGLFPYLAHQQVLKILKPGGVHVFTVPFSEQSHDIIYAKLDETGISFVGTPMMHEDPLRPEGIPVFTVFGYELIYKLCDLGFEAYAHRLHVPREGILGSGAIVFIARKALN